MTFQDWVEARFGRRLYNAFFASYTEKVWGIPGSEIQAEWAAQRIKNFSFAHAVLSILGLQKTQMTTPMWETFRSRVEGSGALCTSTIAARQSVTRRGA